jgi:transcriptional regulator with XRE-family HTH domain
MAGKTEGQSLGDLVREARAKRSSLREFAKILQITPSYLSDIENDRRIPAEDLLKTIANRLDLDFDDLMARAGRLGDDAERYMRKHPTAGVLFRQISESNLAEGDLVKLLKKAEELSRKKDTDT